MNPAVLVLVPVAGRDFSGPDLGMWMVFAENLFHPGPDQVHLYSFDLSD